MCLFPKNVKVRLSSGKEHYILVPCGKCIECLHTRTHDWEFRMIEEKKKSQMSVFVTLTYQDEFLPQNGVEVKHTQDFFKRLRNRGVKFSYYCIGEYGTQNKRPHYHSIIFVKDNTSYHDLLMYINECWRLGFIQVKPVSVGRIHYCIAYLIGQKIPKDKNKPFTTCSKRPAIGSTLLDDKDFVKSVQENNFSHVRRNGKKVHCPRFYKKKLQKDTPKSVDIFKIYCNQCMQEYQRKLDYLRSYSVSNRTDFLRVTPHSDIRDSNILEDWLKYQSYIKQENLNKDFVLKQRSKKLRND